MVVTTDDLAMMYCLGALRRWATAGIKDPQLRPNDRVLEWRPGAYKAVFHFATPKHEADFLAKAEALLPADAWSWTKDPA